MTWPADLGPWLSPLIAALLTAAVGWYTVRQSRRASDRQHASDDRRVDVDEWRGITAGLRGEVDALRDDQREDRERIESLEQRVRDMRRENRDLRQRYDDLLRKNRVWAIYAQALGAIIRAHCPGVAIPPPPIELMPEIDGGKT